MKLTALLLFGFFFSFLPPSLRADVCGAVPGNLVTNCGFETGTFTGWNLSGYQSVSGDLGISHGVDSVDAHSGLYGAYFGGFGGVLNLYQTLTTVPGTLYQVTYWLAQSPATIAPYQTSFATTFSGTTLYSAANLPNLPYTSFTFYTQATSPASILNFGARDDTGFFSIDDITVVPVTTPEPSTFAVTAFLAALLLSGRVRKPAADNPLTAN